VGAVAGDALLGEHRSAAGEIRRLGWCHGDGIEQQDSVCDSMGECGHLGRRALVCHSFLQRCSLGHQCILAIGRRELLQALPGGAGELAHLGKLGGLDHRTVGDCARVVHGHVIEQLPELAHGILRHGLRSARNQ
jgi:hypothetical protein